MATDRSKMTDEIQVSLNGEDLPGVPPTPVQGSADTNEPARRDESEYR